MKLSLPAVLGLAGLAAASQALRPRDWHANDYYVFHLKRDALPAEVAQTLGLRHEGVLGELKDHHVFVGRKEDDDVVKRAIAAARRRNPSPNERHPLDAILMSEKLRLRKPWTKRILPRLIGPQFPPRQEGPVEWAAKKQGEVAQQLGIHDPIFLEQWHLFNSVQVGHDVNVTGLWLEGITGKNATVAIVDDGLDMYSDDLKANYYAAGSYDFNDMTHEPKPRLAEDHHGTRCAGESSAVKNDVCGVGVAYDSKVAGLRILSKLISDADEAVAMNYDFQHNDIYSCSWGPPDDGRSMDAPGILIRRAMLNAVQNGRRGLGSIYVFASGNGAANEDNCNFDGYTNSIYSITVGAVDRKGNHPYYSEKCSAGLVVTYSSGSGDAIHTTDVGQNSCYNGHGGTSAAAPLAAGIFALVLQVRPDISWRDMQYLAMTTAVPINLDSGDWQDTPRGSKFSHTYGYGKIDSYALVEAAKTWQKVKPQAWYYSPWIHVNEAIPQGNKGVAVSFDVTPDMLKEANLERLEHVTVTMNVEHTRRGDLSVDLFSPNKIVSHLSVTRKLDLAAQGYEDWTFMSVAHWGESGIGTWTIIVKDTEVNEFSGTFVDWHLKLWGESKDASKATLLPMPDEDEDANHAATATTTIPAVVTPLPADTPTSGSVTANPTDHPDRPVNGKPTGTTAPTATSTQGQQPVQTPAVANDDKNWLSLLPSFGMSARTQAWVYGSLALIGLFCIGLGLYLWLAHRRRLRNESRDDYQFELLDEEEVEALAGGRTGGEKRDGGVGVSRKKSRRTRGGELYDAFAGGSEDEDELQEAAGYRDRPPAGDSGGDGREQYRAMAERTAPLRESHEEEEELHHVIGDEDEDEDDEDEKPVVGTRR